MRYGYRNGDNCSWGEIFGLKVSDLSIKQLKQLTFKKLLELAQEDSRIDKIIGPKILKANIKEIKTLMNLTTIELKNLPYLISQYNKCIRERCNILEKEEKKNYNYDRNSYIIWNILDKSNKGKEFSKWLDDKSKSVVNSSIIDYEWLYKEYNWLADQVVQKVLKQSYTYPSGTKHLAKTMPKEAINKYIEILFEKNKDIFIHALSNKLTPKKYIIRALRIIAGRKRLPSINVELNKAILEELPPVMRLKLLESLLLYMRGGKIVFSDIKTEEDLKPLLFGTAIKYNSRVSYLVNRFKILYK